MPSLTDIKYLEKVRNKLNAEKPAGIGREGETEYQEREGELQRRLNLEVYSQEGKARILLTGQIGVGKSSELRNFFRQRVRQKKRAGFWVVCDLEKEEHPERCGATGVFLTILRDCWDAAKNLESKLRYKPGNIRDEFHRIRDEISERLIDWLKGVRSDDDTVMFRFGGTDFPIYFRNKDQALALILVKAAQHEAVSYRSERFGLVPDRLIELLNMLLGWLKKVHNGNPPLIIIDHVDKIRDEPSAREVLTEVVPQWQRINSSVIMTAPYEYTLGEMRHSVESYWGPPLMLYPLDIPEPDSNHIPEIYIDIINSCGLSDLIDSDSLKRIAHYSGGIPRTFVQFIIQACLEAHLAGHESIKISDAQSVIYAAERAYQDYGEKELELLDYISDNKIGLGSASTLLRSPVGLLVLSPKAGEQQIRIHPLAESLLDRYRAKKGKDRK
ncbi:hypothetical protein QUF80_05750 [Desulfococcaceae bacterium HSG8]|nr:hypothetical protein [Desulfococcaceae bacterium HSG8]